MRLAPYVRSVKTSSGTTAAQIVYRTGVGRGRWSIWGQRTPRPRLRLLKAAALQKLDGGQEKLPDRGTGF